MLFDDDGQGCYLIGLLKSEAINIISWLSESEEKLQ